MPGTTTASRTRRKPSATSEKAIQAKIVARMRECLWATQHVYRLQCADGSWRTGTTASGWPDLVGVRGQRMVVIEVKRDDAYPTPDQRAWLMRFLAIGAKAWVIRPRDWALVKGWLAHPGGAPDAYGWNPLPDDHPLYPFLPDGKRFE